MNFLGTNVKNYGLPYIVAEISGNHGGDINRAIRLIEEAKLSGANAVKIQCYDADALTLPINFEIQGNNPWKGRNLYELYMETCTPYDWVKPLFEHAVKIKIPIFSSVYDTKGLEVLTKAGCRAFKIASYEANDTGFIEKVVAAGKPVVLSTGGLSSIEIERALKILDPENSIVLHCVSKYPTHVTELALGEIQDLQYSCSQPVGFSCHSDSIIAVLLAAMKGAAMIELHFALDDEEGQKSSDYEFSFIPSSLKEALRLLNDSLKATGYKQHQDNEGKRFKRSLYTTKNIQEGEKFTEFNVGSFRPNLGCEPYLLPNILGRKAAVNIDKYTPMKMEYVK